MTLWGYVRAQIIMAAIAFAAFTGFYIMGIKHFILLALILSLLDVLPVLGPGSNDSLGNMNFAGNLKRSVAILVLYGIVLTVRQLIEPKILSNEIGYTRWLL